MICVGTDNAIYHKYYDGTSGGWGPSSTGYESLGGAVIYDPTAVSWGPGRLDLFVIGTDGGTYHKAYAGGWQPSQTGYEDLGGVAISSVAHRS